MKTWLSNRTVFMDGQFVAPPTLATPPGTVTPGTSVTLTAPTALPLYYTLDGTDPRLPGGGISPKARLYSGPILIDANRRVVVRTRDPAHVAKTGANNPPLLSIWSGPVAGTYVTTPPPVVCTEILFQPMDGPGGAAGDFEFLELKNVGATILDLTGYALRGGVSFDFAPTNPPVRLAPGGRVLLVSHLAAFTNRYPDVTQIAGEFLGQLANEGDRIALFGPLQEVAFDFRYDPAWAPGAAVDGRSLVPSDEAAGIGTDPGLGSSWRASANVGGSPGRMDAASLPPPPPLGAHWGAGGKVEVSFDLPAGRSVVLQVLSVLTAGPWDFQQVFAPSASDRRETLSVELGSQARYFRLVNRVP